MEKDKKAVLVSVVGTTPSILTETAWALAHRDVPVVPDEVVAITTKNGKSRLAETLLEGGVWNDMLACLKREGIDVEGRLVFGSASIHAIPDVRGNEIDDLRTGEDNLRAADFMLAQLRQFTEDCGTELHVSIAGGRKTMSALMFSCMTLLGRDCDKVYHVLLPTELEGGSEPPFYFPKKGTRYKSLLTGKSHAGASLKSAPLVKYLLGKIDMPIGVSDYELLHKVPDNFKSQLPMVEEIEAELANMEKESR